MRKFVLAAGLSLFAAAPAQASSLVYLGDDGNVWLASADGARVRPVTSDASKSRVYKSPTQADDGTIVVVGDRVVHVLRRDGSAKALATDRETSSPFSAHVSADGRRVVYDALYDPFTSAPEFFTNQMTTDAADEGPCGPASPCLSGYTEPRWIPGTTDAAAIRAGRRDAITTLNSSFDDYWFSWDDSGPDIESFDISPTGDNRVLLHTTPDNTSDSTPGTLRLWQNAGAPPAPGGSEVCAVELGTAQSNPRWSPDGRMIAWHDARGIWVSPAPAGSGTCSVSPRLVVPGGTFPEWGRADAPKLTVSAALRHGLPVRVQCSRSCRAQVTVRFGRAVVGKASAKLASAGAKDLRVKLRGSAAKRLKRAKKAALKVQVRTRSGSARARSKTRTVRLG